MITLIGQKNCGRCTVTQKLLTEKNIEFEYKLLSELENQEELIAQATTKGLMGLPLIVKNGEIVTLQEVI